MWGSTLAWSGSGWARLIAVASLLVGFELGLWSVPATAAPCVDGKESQNLSSAFSPDWTQITVTPKQPLCHPVEVVFSAYSVPDDWDGKGFNQTAVPQPMVDHATASLAGSAPATLVVALPCGNVQVDLYYPPVLDTVGVRGHTGLINAHLWHRSDCAPPPDPDSPAADPQIVQVSIPAGALVISTPYTPEHPLDLGTMAIDPSGTLLRAAAPFEGIVVTDTRAGMNSWSASAISSEAVSGTAAINAQNIGLTELAVDPEVAGLAASSARNLRLFDHRAAYPPLAPGVGGTQGLGGEPHVIASACVGRGTVSLHGLLTLTAPTSVPSANYTSTVTFTLV